MGASLMLPNRARLQGWNPGGLSASAPRVTSGGEAVESAVATVASNCRSLPDLKAWSGESHDAATAAFDRSKRPAAAIADAAEAIGQSLVVGSHSIGTARSMLLDKATAIEAGKLSVTDSWVVLLNPIALTRAEAIELQTLQAAEQTEINRLLVAVDDADNATARDLSAAAQRFGFTPPTSNNWFDAIVTSGSARPNDDVADPRQPMTLMAQKEAQATDAATTVAAKTEGTRTDGSTDTVITMQDGSRREIHEWKDKVPGKGQMPLFFDGNSPTTGSSETTFDPAGNRVMTISSSTSMNGTTRRIVQPDGSGVVAFIGAEGQKSGWTFRPDGSIDEDLPTDAPFFTHPILTSTGGAMSGLQALTDNPKVSEALGATTTSKITAGMKYGGPALGIATTVFDMAVADNQYDACRALYSGVAGTIGSGLGGTIGAGVGAPGGPLAVASATGGAMAGTWILGKIGDEIGQMVCAK